jgi:hypothetical protein
LNPTVGITGRSRRYLARRVLVTSNTAARLAAWELLDAVNELFPERFAELRILEWLPDPEDGVSHRRTTRSFDVMLTLGL